MTAAVRERPRTNAETNSIASHRAAPTRKTQSRKTTVPRQRPKLKVLNQQAIRQRARRRNALLTLFILVLLGFFAVAFIQAQLVADQQDLDVLRARIAKAETDNARMARDVEIASSPAVIVNRAKDELGMVRAYQPVYLEAVAPVRDIPNAPVFDPETSQGFELAAPQAASASGISAGISAGVAVSSVDPAGVVSESAASDNVVETAAAPQVETEAPPPTEPAAQPVVITSATPVEKPVTSTSSLSGTVAVSEQTVTPTVSPEPATVETQPVVVQTQPAAAVSAGTVAQTASGPAGSLAGSRAVTGGSGNG